ncbi:MAG: preprotein translocase subunit YajC [Bacteroidetes bacterium]|nr:preprotein translocase subunit YajC [Bacteroidota bacterium]MDA0950314.1 preprotein translocase subunit YajC [Bacteroidota bacterium]
MEAISQFLPLILIFVVAYFFMIRPQMKRQKDEKKFITALKKGDRVITKSGLHGKIMEINDADKTVVIETLAGKLKLENSSVSHELSQKLQKT